ncbi:MAG: hypothetical protein QF619_07800, partial [Candidatus Binatia bacterium]|nr:hypothetical protein [Candidatus Binatia bacterium]
PVLLCPQGYNPLGSLSSCSFSVEHLLCFDAGPLRPVEHCPGPKGKAEGPRHRDHDVTVTIPIRRNEKANMVC